MSIKRVLIIAGSDSSGGAGLEADQRVLAAHGVYALTATTGLTAQNTLGVQDIFIVPAQFVKKQINAGLEDVGADVVKLGMLSSEETIDVIAEALTTHRIACVVLDPVMVSTSGSQLLPEAAVQSLRTKLLPLTTILTPNIPEAILLLKDAGVDVQLPKDLSELTQLAKQVRALGPKTVLLKGGHLPLTAAHEAAQNPEDASRVIDILYDGENTTLFETEFLMSKNTHGTGCSLASAIAANLALGKDMKRAVHSAVRFVEAGIKTSVDMGKGSGPINHFHSVYSLPFAPDRFLEYALARPDVRPIWKKFTEHEFVHGLGSGKLPVERFKQYLVQDYLYLVHFARSNSLAAYKAKSMASVAAIVLHIERETALHLDYCASFGLSKAEMESYPESLACTAYSRYILDVGQSEDWLALQMALAPCLIGYGAIAKRLYTEKETLREGNRYWRWIENYVAEDYTEAVRLGSVYVADRSVLELLETHIRQVSPSRMEELIKIFIRATELEISFWDMGLGDHPRAHMTSLSA
ncbi:thiamin biosynthesis protein (Thi-4), putative [Aspergillus fumigatus A1163]|uniref:Thiamin biosynthesis protein (Thi-4), putative n=2 Tax=Aspergillus fumigatus TaxID=746128 RepID=Q4X196_ASPFU|nr:thiamin biosynthesis protein (Thi-4), putative [Aspergillus fumigatus Af293]EAL93369.1 thiamin biosynthesis protein (Thi-4), putative [Aspergillus fumigatus Af293]EDP54593.1 thiamin biosynthesis protein (Thi-4), putative [Aspergillus fumigatus A1163]